MSKRQIGGKVRVIGEADSFEVVVEIDPLEQQVIEKNSKLRRPGVKRLAAQMRRNRQFPMSTPR